MILVTGGTGLVGAHLLLHLAGNGQKIRSIYRTDEKLQASRDFFAHFGKQSLFESIEWAKGDILDVPSLEAAFKGIEKVYHCAAFISYDPKDEEMLRKVNIEGTANMVNCALDFGVKKFCHVSSIAALGDAKADEPITEETDWNPEAYHSNYAISKYGAEMEVWRAWQEGLHVVIVNPGLILGYGFWNQGSGKLFSAVAREQYFYTKGSCGVVAVEDVVKAMIYLMESDINGERYTLVSENMSFRELLDTIAKGMGKKGPSMYAPRFMTSAAWRIDWLLSKLFMYKRTLTRSMARSSHNTENYDNSKIKALGWQFIDVQACLRKLAEGYRAS